MLKSEIRNSKVDPLRRRDSAARENSKSEGRMGRCDRGVVVQVSDFEFRRTSHSGFTLIELILVMAILTMAVSVTAPTLAHFFRGRTLDSEARRLLALTRSGQNRAVSEGIPMDLWVNADGGSVGLEAEPSFETGDSKAVEFTLDTGVRIEVVKQPIVNSLATNFTRSLYISTASVPPVKLTHPNYPTIRFLPDGSVAENSPQTLRLTGRDGVSLSVALSQDKLSYEIQRTEK